MQYLFITEAVDAAENGSYEEALVLVDKSLQISQTFILHDYKGRAFIQKGVIMMKHSTAKKAEQNHKDNPYIWPPWLRIYRDRTIPEST